jgi:acyl-coenzyme A synthetase/AMP-(fatty) acid ligase
MSKIFVDNKMFFDKLGVFGARSALVDETGAVMSYLELEARVQERAVMIGGSRRLVFIESSNSCDFVIWLLACLVGRHPVIIGPAGGGDRIGSLFAADVLINDAAGLVDRGTDTGSFCHPDLGLLLSTSGSTGATKLVRLARSAVHANACSIAEYLELREADRAITTLPLAYSYGLSVLFSHLASGASVVVTGLSVMDEQFRALCAEARATSLAGVPYTYELLEACRFAEWLPPTVNTLTQAGGQLDPDLANRFTEWAQVNDVRFFTMYGQTEATARMAFLRPELRSMFADCVGQAIPGGKLRVTDDAGTGLLRGETGELRFAGPSIMMGYAYDVADLAMGPAIDELRTGDLGLEVADGIFKIVGRLSRFSKIGGMRIDLDQIERHLRGAGVTAIVTGNDRMVAIGVSGKDDLEKADHVVSDNVAIPWGARQIFWLPDVPRFSSGKIDYPAVLERGLEIGRETKSVTLEIAYGKALGQSAVPRDQSFQALGGDSLGYIQVSMAIEAVLGFLPDGWERLSIEEIEALARPGAPANRHFRDISSEVAFRAISIIAIVWNHSVGGSKWLAGGALALLIAAGYNSARFQRERLVSDRRLGLIWQFLFRFIVPYYCVLAAYEMFSPNQIGLPTLLLINNVINDAGIKNMVQFWFIQTLFHCQIMLVSLFYIMPVRRLAVNHRWIFSLTLLCAATIMKHVLTAIFPSSFEFRTDMWVYAFALGWVIEAADSLPKRLLAVAIVLMETSTEWSLFDMHVVFAVCLTVAILFIPRLKLWTPISMLTIFVAQASYYIYLSQGVMINIMRERLHIPFAIILTPLSIACGLLFYIGWRQALAVSRTVISGPLYRSLGGERVPVAPSQPALLAGGLLTHYSHFWRSVRLGRPNFIGRAAAKFSVYAGKADGAAEK